MPLYAVIWIFAAAALFLTLVFYRVYRRRRRLIRRNLALRRDMELIFEFIHDIGETFVDNEDIDTDSTLNRILLFAIKAARSASGAIYLFNAERTRLFARAVSGIFPPLYDTDQIPPGRDLSTTSKHLEAIVKARPVSAGEGIVGTVAALGTGIIIEDAELDARIPVFSDPFLKITTLVAVPMRFGNEVLGVVVLTNRIDGKLFTPGDLTFHQAMCDQASVPVHYAGLRDALEQKRQLDRSMQTARQIQSSLLPQKLPESDAVKILACNIPAYDIGGDYYDVIQIDQSHIGIAIADVSGKGIAGAMMMAVCQGVLRARASQELSPAKILSELNAVLSANLAEDMFITMLYMVINTETRTMQFARAGHDRPLLKRRDSETVEAIDGAGIAIGLADPEIFNSAIQDITIQLGAGDVVVLYTDGVTEALNKDGDEWGLAQLNQTIIDNSAAGIEKLMNSIRGGIALHVGAQPQYDDMTLVALAIQ